MWNFTSGYPDIVYLSYKRVSCKIHEQVLVLDLYINYTFMSYIIIAFISQCSKY